MDLSTEDFGDVPNVDAATLDEALATDAFGKFAVLIASEDAFIQAGNDWQPTDECAAFMAANASDPWVLEYREGGRQFQAAERITLDQVRQAFRAYLTGEAQWRTNFAWNELKL